MEVSSGRVQKIERHMKFVVELQKELDRMKESAGYQNIPHGNGMRAVINAIQAIIDKHVE